LRHGRPNRAPTDAGMRWPDHRESICGDRLMTESQQRISATSTSAPDESRPRKPQTLVLGRILRRRRCLVALGALLPAVLVGVALRLLPTVYTATLIYERPLTASEYRVFRSRFYSAENLGRIIARLRDSGIAEYAVRLERAGTEEALESLIRMRVFPAFPTPLQTLDQEMAELISNFQTQLLYVEMTGPSKEELAKVSDIITADIEDVLPLYDVRDDLKESVRTVRTHIAEILDHRSAPTADLQREQARLALANQLLEEVQGHLSADYTVQQYLRFLDEQLAGCESEEVASYLRTYIRQTQNLAHVGSRTTEKPLVLAVSKHVAMCSVLAFVVSLMVATFVAVALEQRNDALGLASRHSGTSGQLS